MMRKGKSVLDKPPLETQERIYRLGESKTLDEMVVLVNAPESEGGFGIKIERSALRDWLAKQRNQWRALDLGARLRRGRERLAEAESMIQESDPAAYDAANMAALRELVLDMQVTGDFESKDICMLYSVLQQQGKLVLDREKLEISKREVAVQEKKLAIEVVAKSKEIIALLRDRTLSEPQRLAGVQTILFGEKPADVPTLAQIGGQKS
jgi:hypothetical protein